jgi:integrase
MGDYLHQNEIAKLVTAAKVSPRHMQRNNLLVMLALRHALRISEVVDLRLADIDLTAGRILCRRLKGSVSNTHPMEGDEIRATRKWLRERPEAAQDFTRKQPD